MLSLWILVLKVLTLIGGFSVSWLYIDSSCLILLWRESYTFHHLQQGFALAHVRCPVCLVLAPGANRAL